MTATSRPLRGADGRAAGRRLVAALVRLAQAPPVGVLILLSLFAVVIGLLQKWPCDHGQSPPDYGWSRACYTDVLPLYGGRGLGDGALPYLQSKIEYPVLIGLYMGLIGLPIHWLGSTGRLDGPAHALGFETVDQGIVNFWATAAVSGLLVVATTWLLARMRSGRRGDVLLWALAPSMVLAFPVNWDMVAVLPAVAGLMFWSRGRAGWSGVCIGLGTAAKLFPVLFLGPLLLLCWRAGTPAARRAAGRVSLGAAAAWTAVNLPIAHANPGNWWEAYRFSITRWIDWGTLYYLADHLSEPLGLHDAVLPFIGPVPALNRTSLLLFLACCLGIGALILLAPQPPRVSAMAFLVVAAFVLTNKVWSQQFVLWLLPLAVLARPRWRAMLGWQAIEVAYLLAFLRVVIAGKDDYSLVQTSLARWLAVAVLAGLVVAEAMRPQRDPLRGPGLTDPDAGPLAVTRTEPDDEPVDEPISEPVDESVDEPVDEPVPGGSAPPQPMPGDAQLAQQFAEQGQ
jgi:uncharacterized membrane protein